MKEIAEKVLDTWLRMTTIINNNKLTRDIPLNEALILRLLIENEDEDYTMTDLCQKTMTLKSQMNKTLANMEKKGLIYKERSKDDKRQVFVRMKKEARPLFDAQHEKIIGLVLKVIDDVGYEHVKTLIEVFEKVAKAASKEIYSA